MEQILESRNKPSDLWSLVFNKGDETLCRERVVRVLTKGAGIVESPHAKGLLYAPTSHHAQKLTQNTRANTLNLLQGNTREKSSRPGLGFRPRVLRFNTSSTTHERKAMT